MSTILLGHGAGVMWQVSFTWRLGVTTRWASFVRRPPGRKQGIRSTTIACVGSGRRNEPGFAAAWQMNDTFPLGVTTS